MWCCCRDSGGSSQAGSAAVSADELRAAGIRVETDLRNEKINYKVREHSLAKVPNLLVLGKREAEEAGLRAVPEFFVDRGYTPEGGLVSRREPGALLDDTLAHLVLPEDQHAATAQLETSRVLAPGALGEVMLMAKPDACAHLVLRPDRQEAAVLHGEGLGGGGGGLSGEDRGAVEEGGAGQGGVAFVVRLVRRRQRRPNALRLSQAST